MNFYLLKLPRIIKQSLAIIFDCILCLISIWISFYLRLGEFNLSNIPILTYIISVSLSASIFYFFGFYKTIFRFAIVGSFRSIINAFSLYLLIFSSVLFISEIKGIPRTIGFIQPIILFLLVVSSRKIVALMMSGNLLPKYNLSNSPNILIYGAGNAGQKLAMTLLNNNEMSLVGFLDDDKNLQGKLLMGRPIFNPKNLNQIAKLKKIKTILLALPSLERKRRNEIIRYLIQNKLNVRSIPSLNQLIEGKKDISSLKDIDINDLLGRELVQPDKNLLEKNIKHKVVLVTGAGGSIGSELCRQIIKLSPKKLVLFEQNEFNLYKIHQELLSLNLINSQKLFPLLASVREKKLTSKIIQKWQPDTIYHAAAYKHVPLVEFNQAEGIKNNLLGTLNIAKIAVDNKIKNFVLISSDKAVNPTNIMGASKRLSEMVVQSLSDLNTSTNFSIVRFGNVLGSSGSVVPIFRDQIKQGKAVTLTHPEVMRYFMSVEEAAQLVIQAGAISKGNQIFVLDMGEQIKIYDLAKSMIELSGNTVKDKKNIDGDVEIVITGLRPGEKLYEELNDGEFLENTSHPRIKVTKDKFLKFGELEKNISDLINLFESDNYEEARLFLQNIISGYKPRSKIADFYYK